MFPLFTNRRRTVFSPWGLHLLQTEIAFWTSPLLQLWPGQFDSYTVLFSITLHIHTQIIMVAICIVFTQHILKIELILIQWLDLLICQIQRVYTNYNIVSSIKNLPPSFRFIHSLQLYPEMQSWQEHGFLVHCSDMCM